METVWYANSKAGIKAKAYASLSDGDPAHLRDPDVGSIDYVWDADYSGAESGYDNLEVDDSGGGIGRFRRCLPYITGMAMHDNFSDFVAAEHKTIVEARTDAGTLVIEDRTSDPASPTEYSMWIRTDLI